MSPCSICTRRAHAQGLCGAHYLQARARGTITVRPPIDDFWSAVDKSAGPQGCWPWMRGRHQFGHGHYKQKKTHRIAWELTNGPIPPGLFVLHRCDNPPCCNPTHLFLGTQLDNMRDRNRKGRANIRRGVDHHGARLSALDVEAAFVLFDQGWRLADIAGVLQVSISTVSAVISGKRYAEALP